MTENTIKSSAADIQRATSGDDEWGSGEETYDDDDGEGDIDAAAEAEAEEIARRLGDQLWASINKAQAEGAATSQEASAQVALVDQSEQQTMTATTAALATMKTILASVEKDTLARSVFMSTLVPECNGANVLDVLNRTVAEGSISKTNARILSNLLMALARSEVLFGVGRHSGPSTALSEREKRRRGSEGDPPLDSARPGKRAAYAHCDLQTQITEAVRAIAAEFASNECPGSLNTSAISSIHLQLHQVFLFSVTSSARGGPEMSALRELSGLIQILGILSGIQIGAVPSLSSARPPLQPLSYNATSSWITPLATDIGTAVYPCLTPSCNKFFSRLFSLRAHQRMHAVHRPFRCTICPAAFARNHDLRRHAKLHDKKAWKCCGCSKVFSRRDAIKRHKDKGSSKGFDGEPCRDKEVIEVDVEREEGEMEGRRAKIWAGEMSATAQTCGENTMEEGEISPSLIREVQAVVLSLSDALRTHVRNVIGTASSTSIPMDIDPKGDQATLASIIAHAQAQNLPKNPAAAAVHDAATSTSQPQLDPMDNLMLSSAPSDVPLAAYGLSDEQTKMLEQAIANAAAAAQAQAEAEAALEEEEYENRDEDEEVEDDGGEVTA